MMLNLAKFTSSSKTESLLKARKKGRAVTQLNAEFQRIARRDKKAFLSEQCKEIEKPMGCERLEISSSKLEIPKDHFMQRWAQ